MRATPLTGQTHPKDTDTLLSLGHTLHRGKKKMHNSTKKFRIVVPNRPLPPPTASFTDKHFSRPCKTFNPPIPTTSTRQKQAGETNTGGGWAFSRALLSFPRHQTRRHLVRNDADFCGACHHILPHQSLFSARPKVKRYVETRYQHRSKTLYSRSRHASCITVPSVAKALGGISAHLTKRGATT